MSLFPMIQPEAIRAETALPLCREVDWDFELNIPIYKNGSPSFITGARAVLVWAWNALHTPRYRYEIYTWNYGNEVEQLIGQPFTDDLKRSEVTRFVRECLLINPYITDVADITVSFANETVKVSCRIITVYGEVNLSV